MRTNYHAKLEIDHFYHIYNRTNGNDLMFIEPENYRYFLSQWKKYFEHYLDTYAYCLMSNHFHFIASVKKVDAAFMDAVQNEQTVAAKNFIANPSNVNTFLEDQFKRFFNSYTAAINKQQKRHGSLFQKRFRRIHIGAMPVLLEKICYVHHNPIHHGIGSTYDCWQYSSYNAYLSTKPTAIARQKGLLLFHTEVGSVQAFVAYHEAYRISRLGYLGDDIEKDF
jgi:putative transposase